VSTPGGDPGSLGGFVAVWAAMTAAMMLPASAPVLLRVARAWRLRSLAFLTGYLAVWMAAGLIGYGLVEGVRGLHVGALGWAAAGRYLAAVAVAAAGLYQLTHAKRRWLERCTCLAHNPDPGVSSLESLRSGLDHGRSCVACSFTLMIALYALGMMSFTWMAAITVLVVGERWLARPALAVGIVAAVLVVLGVGVAAAPSAVPGLTVPGQHMAAMSAMSPSPEWPRFGRGPRSTPSRRRSPLRAAPSTSRPRSTRWAA
jgi:predicted metal-binding membrane protein